MSDSPGSREVARRLFAAEFEDAELSYSESDEERAPNYVVTPTGARVNRLFVAGVLTEVEQVNEDTCRGRIVDPSGAFVTYAGQYQPDEQAFLERSETPSFVALTGKARTFQPEDSDRVFTSVRPESVNNVDADTRDRWIVSAAEATLDRLAVFHLAQRSDLRGEDLRTALETAGVDASLAAGIPLALDHYDTSPAYVEAVRRLAVDALELVAGERDEVRAPSIAPDEGGTVAVGSLPATDVSLDEVPDRSADESERETVDVDDAEESPSTEAEGSSSVDADQSLSTETGESSTDDTVETATDDAEAVSTDDAEEMTVDAASGSDDAESGATSEPETSDELGAFDVGDDADTGDSDDADTDDSDTADTDDSEAETAADPSEAAGGDLYELDDEERAEVESEFGTEFSTGTEVDDPGEADIDVPDADDLEEMAADSEATGTTDVDAAESEPAGDSDTADATGSESDTGDAIESTDAGDEGGESDEGSEETIESDDEVAIEADDKATEPDDFDLESAVVDTMAELDDGDGADHDTVVETVVSEYGLDASDVEDAIQDALMSGKCYEPDEGTLKAI